MVLEMQNVVCVLLDIEGTICPTSFVKETLFPYALKALPDILDSKWRDDEFKPYRDAFPGDVQGSPQALQAHVEDLTKRDVKIAYLKNLQGYLWENGYKTGAYSTPLFSDVSPQFKKWRNAGFDLAIYSSGSVLAQKLLFGHVKSGHLVAGQKRGRPPEDSEGDDEAIGPALKRRAAVAGSEISQRPITETAMAPESGEAADASVDTTHSEDNISADDDDLITEDLQWLFRDWFDTTNAGPKTDASSYEKIAAILETLPSDMLFLSDNVQEVDAALAAGMQSILVDRPGNAPLSEEDKSRLSVVETLDDIKLGREEMNGGADLRVSSAQKSKAGAHGTLGKSDAK